MPASSADIEEQAISWAMRYPLSPEDARGVELWLLGDPRHAGALLRAQAVLSVIEDDVRAEHDLPVSTPSHPFLVGRRGLAGGLFGGIAATLLGLVGWEALRPDRTATTRGEIRRLPLTDGSVATIDTESALEVSMARARRQIDLVRGQAWFQVAHDARRPFVVDAGIAQARAVGTAFSARRSADDVHIAVEEGTVMAWARGADGATQVLHAGQYAIFTRDGAPPQVSDDMPAVARSLAWREGEIALNGDTLASAAAQFNRYNARQIIIDDQLLATQPLIGLFRVDDPSRFAAVVADMLHCEIVETSTEIRIRARTT